MFASTFIDVTARKPIAFEEVVAFAVVSSNRINAGGVLITLVFTITFVNIGASRALCTSAAITGVARVTGALKARIGIGAGGVGIAGVRRAGHSVLTQIAVRGVGAAEQGVAAVVGAVHIVRAVEGFAVHAAGAHTGGAGCTA